MTKVQQQATANAVIKSQYKWNWETCAIKLAQDAREKKKLWVSDCQNQKVKKQKSNNVNQPLQYSSYW